jgi:hypothetical protein
MAAFIFWTNPLLTTLFSVLMVALFFAVLDEGHPYRHARKYIVLIGMQ